MPRAPARETPLRPVISARLPMAAARRGGCISSAPKMAARSITPSRSANPTARKPVLARLHSACFTGDVLGSLKCDCGPQLHGALAQMGQEGAGVLLYLNQEGRGIGLANKMRAYSLQDQGFDTVEANHRLGFEDDERDFRIGAELLRNRWALGGAAADEQPAQGRDDGCMGITVVERVPLKVGETPRTAPIWRPNPRNRGICCDRACGIWC
jgi:GTP cyclohydrolase II